VQATAKQGALVSTGLLTGSCHATSQGCTACWLAAVWSATSYRRLTLRHVTNEALQQRSRLVNALYMAGGVGLCPTQLPVQTWGFCAVQFCPGAELWEVEAAVYDQVKDLQRAITQQMTAQPFNCARWFSQSIKRLRRCHVDLPAQFGSKHAWLQSMG